MIIVFISYFLNPKKKLKKRIYFHILKWENHTILFLARGRSSYEKSMNLGLVVWDK